MKRGVLLINLGTPDACDPKSVRRYLKEFLNDKRMVELPFLIRYCLINGIILPFRYKKSAHAYQQIWTEQGSPLLVNSESLKAALEKKLGNEIHVALAMRYGKPSIAEVFKGLQLIDHLTVIPLFPQYSSAATGSALEEFFNVLAKYKQIPSLKIIHQFYHYPAFIDAYAEHIQNELNKHIDINNHLDTIIFSFHGLPQNHIKACQHQCHQHTCPTISEKNNHCYRAQCHDTATLLAQKLNIFGTKYRVSFQSRLGRTPWIKPYTDILLEELIAKNKKNIAIVCPSFVCDCLETLEEINIRAREKWKTLGGEQFIFIPALNQSAPWVEALSEMVIR